MNKAILVGRLTKDPEMRTTSSGIAVTSFTVAVNRNYSDQSGERQTDFINCVAWRQQAEFIGRYFRKGRMIAVEGELRTRTYDDKNGTKHYTTDVYVDGVSFTGERASDSVQNSSTLNYTANNESPQRASQTDKNEFGDLTDFEEVLDNDGVPF